LVELYNAKFGNLGQFESQVLIELMKRMGMNRNYFLEQELKQAEFEKVMPFYELDS